MQEFFESWLYEFKDNYNDKYLEDFLYVNLINNHIKLEFTNNANQNLYACFVPKEELVEHITMSDTEDKVLYLNTDNEYYKNPGYQRSAQALYMASQNRESYYAMWLYLIITQMQLYEIKTSYESITNLKDEAHDILYKNNLTDILYFGGNIKHLLPDFETIVPKFESEYSFIDFLYKQLYFILGKNYLLIFDGSKEEENIIKARKKAAKK